MPKSSFTRTSFIALVAVSLSALAGPATAAQLKSRALTPPPSALGLKAAQGGGQSKGHVETCNNIASCNLMIAYCIGHGGDWTETGEPGPKGEPQQGNCQY